MDYAIMRQRLREAREKIGCNRRDFADLIGVPYRTITNYELGEREPGSDYIILVADTCGVTTDWILGRTDNQSGTKEDRPETVYTRLFAACVKLNDAAIEKVVTYAIDLGFNPGNAR